jgi:glycosyltransferase involved in cell wall biosynthesis
MSSIINQTYENWECIVIDGYSNDGTFEYLVENFNHDRRFCFYQYPSNGPYDAWNKGILKSNGDLIYIATSDDTMLETFLEEMIKALDKNKDCDLAHCNLSIIDVNTNSIEPNPWNTYLSTSFYNFYIHTSHKRLAPLDGVLHAFLFTIYTSITQLLIRKKVFYEIGMFSTEYGSLADFLWGMNVSLKFNTIHVPQYLATWRIHPNQLTSSNDFQSAKIFSDCLNMTIKALEDNKSNKLVRFKKFQLLWTYKTLYTQGHLNSLTHFNKIMYLVKQLFNDTRFTLKFIYVNYILNKRIVDRIADAQEFISLNGLKSNIIYQ